MLGAAASRTGTAGAKCHRGRPGRVWLALPSWRWACAWAWVCLRVAVVGRRRLTVVIWRRSWVSAGLRVCASSMRGPWWQRGSSRWGRVLGARLGFFPRGLGGGVLDEDVVVVVGEGVVVVEVVES